MSTITTFDDRKTRVQKARPRRVIRVGIVGCGPRGLQCLHNLSQVAAQAAAEAASVTFEVTVFEPSAYPGAGCVYDPQQPHYLRMNIATHHIDFWKTDTTRPSRRLTSLIGWLSKHYPGLAAVDQYIPRAIVGEYLHDCFQTVCRTLQRTAALQINRDQVTKIDRLGSQWRIQCDSYLGLFDEVVIATGHEGFRKTDQFGAAVCAASVFPVQRNLSPAQVPAGCSVLIRGFGLTAIDAALALTEGRGGRFESDRLPPVYHPSQTEPARIDIRSRSGRPMLAKPMSTLEPADETFWRPFQHRLHRLKPLHGRLRFRRNLWPVVIDAAAALMRESGLATRSSDIENWYRGWSRYTMDDLVATKTMLQSYHVAIGAAPLDIPAALAESWRRLYYALADLISHGGLIRHDHRNFARVAREMERIALGPPAENLGRMLSLIQSGIVSVGPVAENTADAANYDCVVDAVIAAANEPAVQSPLRKLIEAGYASVDETTGAIKVDECGRVIGSQKCDGLAVFGRATEGWIIGNDTLNRTLHQHISRWARSIRVQD